MPNLAERDPGSKKKHSNLCRFRYLWLLNQLYLYLSFPLSKLLVLGPVYPSYTIYFFRPLNLSLAVSSTSSGLQTAKRR